MRRTAFAIFVIASILGPATRASATITVVGLDRASETVGVAGATCAAEDFAAAAILVPGVGAAAVHGTRDPGPAIATAEAFAPGTSAEDIVRIARSDPATEDLEAGAVTLRGVPAAVASPNRSTPEAAGDTDGRTVAVQGTFLADQQSVRAAVTAFRAADGPLATRLLIALERAERAGGDIRCGDQRATSAFLIVARRPGPPIVPARGVEAARARRAKVLAGIDGQIAADQVEELLLGAVALPRPTGPGAPTVYLSLLQPVGGFDAVGLLRKAYEQTELQPIATTPSAVPEPEPARNRPGPDLVSVSLLAGVMLVAILLLARRGRGRQTRSPR